ncbi:YetF domain-containing protein [Oceanobacillus halophilus]|uniref:DUF421 domain-containing protein n=1 Tax=Oceanobacillus halophilus TaxID=930130 RepID=A0A494ZRS5_9BACI|nr:DUF421 domain-containing protein [Oceanobacillus halophilus]RKQ28182.1 DUF421 domain-containing protein [Oceanobacillus halophilus]
MDLSELISRIVLGFLVLFAVARILGRKEISQMTFFNFVSAIAIGSISANLVVNQNLSIRNGIIAIIGWGVFSIAMDFLDIKSKPLRKVLTGDPTIVIKDGRIVEKALRSERLDLDSLNAMLRKENIFSINDVDYAIFETDGQLSVLLKEDKKLVTKTDMNVAKETKIHSLPTEVISDGNVLTRNLETLKLDQNWLTEQLKKQQIHSPSEVLFAQVQTDGTLFVNRKGEGMSKSFRKEPNK